MTDSEPRPLTLPDLLEAMADAVGERTFVETIDETYTYARVDERANRLANHLLAHGIGRGDHVAVHAHNRIEWIDAFFGTLKIGAVPININYKYLHGELAHLYDNADCVAAVIAPEYVDIAGDLLTPLKHVPVMDGSVRRRDDRRRGPAPAGRPRGRRPLRHLHRRHHRVTQGRGLAAGRPDPGRPQRRATAHRSSRWRRSRPRRPPSRTRWC
nr:AMP-binding protein [Nocardioides sp. B-3]